MHERGVPAGLAATAAAAAAAASILTAVTEPTSHDTYFSTVSDTVAHAASLSRRQSQHFVGRSGPPLPRVECMHSSDRSRSCGWWRRCHVPLLHATRTLLVLPAACPSP